eukprot:TRINITY_DN10809_c0_g1_i1.p3 TRINITY_DN10809_c0_g1~~TRINITY_DN10809_c0_g1_i1.p3  ORF type:complete len:210 (+),score=2.34 TRINITY_DN10809_c0_g1_i1:4346-4975(+)
MSGTIVFIDDEEDSRFLYGGALRTIYANEYPIEAIEPGNSISEMVETIHRINDIVSVVIDEKLQVVGGANYRGSELVEAIRAYDSKVPLYILTSEMTLLTPPFGSVEYIIDKNRILQSEYKLQCSILMRRHINTFRDIQTKRAERFNELLRKSLDEQLSDAEIDEYNELDFIRVRRIMAKEEIIGSQKMDEQQQLIEEIEQQLKKVKGQ